MSAAGATNLRLIINNRSMMEATKNGTLILFARLIISDTRSRPHRAGGRAAQLSIVWQRISTGFFAPPDAECSRGERGGAEEGGNSTGSSSASGGFRLCLEEGNSPYHVFRVFAMTIQNHYREFHGVALSAF